MAKEDEFRSNADECQRMADRTVNGAEKVQWLRLAQSWLRMIHTRDRPSADGFDGAKAPTMSRAEEPKSSH